MFALEAIRFETELVKSFERAKSREPLEQRGFSVIIKGFFAMTIQPQVLVIMFGQGSQQASRTIGRWELGPDVVFCLGPV